MVTELHRADLKPSRVRTARALRRESTVAEELLWARLRGRKLNGYKFRRQQPFDAYVLDFYCAEARLAVELDGAPHTTADGQAMDAVRDGWLAENGVQVLRFWNEELQDLDSVVERIVGVLGPHPLTPSPARGEGETGTVFPDGELGTVFPKNGVQTAPHPSAGEGQPLPQRRGEGAE